MQQASAIPFRRTAAGVEFCLITSIGKGNWGFPKGIIDPGFNAEQTALQESWEEAGLRGRIVHECVGRYKYEKWNTTLHVQVMLMEVTEAAEQWIESSVRQRAWCSLDEALEKLTKKRLRKPLLAAAKHLGMRQKK